MELVCIDFVGTTKCVCCNRVISKGVAYVLRDNNGNMHYGGKSCARKKFPERIKSVPNLTRGMVMLESMDSNMNRVHDLKNYNNKEREDFKIVVEYLLLRCEKLSDFKNIEYPPIVEIYERYKLNCMTTEDLKYVSNLIGSVETRNPKYSYKNLMACYSTKSILQFLIKETNKAGFAVSLLESLQNYYKLTERQIAGLNKWIENYENLSNIKSNWFYQELSSNNQK